MPVFISHTKKNRADVERLADLQKELAALGMDDWVDREKVRPGDKGPREQLWAGIRDCETCVFIATKHSLDSDWCKSELSAFWGLGREVIIWLAGVEEENLTPPFDEGMPTASVKAAADAAVEAVKSFKREEEERALPLVATLQVDEFEEMIRRAAGLVGLRRGQDIYALLMIVRAGVEVWRQSGADTRPVGVAEGQLSLFVGLPLSDLVDPAIEVFGSWFEVDCGDRMFLVFGPARDPDPAADPDPAKRSGGRAGRRSSNSLEGCLVLEWGPGDLVASASLKLAVATVDGVVTSDPPWDLRPGVGP